MPLDLDWTLSFTSLVVFLFLLLVLAKDWLIIDVVDLVSEFDTEVTSLDPGRFYFRNYQFLL